MRVLPGLILSAILVLPVLAQQAPKTLAIVNGESITEVDLARSASGRIRQLTESRDPSQSDASFEREKRTIQWDALNSLIERRLIRAEAARRKISEDALIENEIDKRTELPPPEVVTAFTEANRVRMPLIAGLSPAEVFSQVRGFLYVHAGRLVRDAFFEKLAAQYDVKTFLDPVRADVATEGHPALGAATAPVTIVEFSSFDCVQCATLAKTLQALQKTNDRSVRVVYRQFPEAHLHAAAQKAAEASLCADKQQRFWEFHDSLFANQKELKPEDLKKRAAQLGLDTAAFNACLDSGAQVRAVDKDIDDAGDARTMMAPTLFINGRMLAGERTASEVQKLIDEELRLAGDAANLSRAAARTIPN